MAYDIFRKLSKDGGNSYTMVRTYTDLTLVQAEEHCNDPETSSRTCSKVQRKGATIWFDVYVERKPARLYKRPSLMHDAFMMIAMGRKCKTK